MSYIRTAARLGAAHPAAAGVTLLAGAALGFAAGLAADPVRRAALQGGETLAGDWFDILKAEHAMVDKAFELLLRTGDTETGKRRAILKKISWSLYKHGLQEEAAIYPALRESREDAARRLADEHFSIKSFIYELDTSPADSDAWLRTARAFHELIARHVREEEDDVFPALRDHLSKDENSALGRRMLYEGFKIA